MSAVVFSKDVRLDSKHRVTVKSPVADHYRMNYHEDGSIIMEPMELVSKQAVMEMKKAVDIVKQGGSGEVVDMSLVADILGDA